MACLANALYDPAAQVNFSTSAALAMTAFDTTNLRLTFTVPASGKVLVRIAVQQRGSNTVPVILLGVMEGSTVIGRMAPMYGVSNLATSSHYKMESMFVVSGLTPGASLNWDAAYGVELAVTGDIRAGGPNDTTASNAYGAIVFEIWNA